MPPHNQEQDPGSGITPGLQPYWQILLDRTLAGLRAAVLWLGETVRNLLVVSRRQAPIVSRAVISRGSRITRATWLVIRQRMNQYQAIAAVWWQHNEPVLRDRAHQYSLLMRLDKPIGTLLLLWPTLWALWIATDGLPSPHLLLVFIAGVFLTRSAGCIMNDYADRNFDRYVARTSERPLTTGKVTPREAGFLMTVLLAAAFLLVLSTNRLTVMLSFIAVPLGGLYPFMKRITYFPQLFQGMAFGWGIPMAFAAADNTVPRIAWLLFVANILWSISYDTVYAMIDREDDKKLGIKSTAILFEDSDRMLIGIFQAMLLLALALAGLRLEFSRYYFLSLAVVAAVILHLQYLIKDRIPERCFLAFKRNNLVGAVVFAGIVIHYYYSVAH
jgi:4-hydroxybenzoate polyprenyltransferase